MNIENIKAYRRMEMTSTLLSKLDERIPSEIPLSLDREQLAIFFKLFFDSVSGCRGISDICVRRYAVQSFVYRNGSIFLI